MKIIIWRDSVCMGDDCDAPHELILDVDIESTLQEITDLLLKKSYLASISTGKANWILKSDRELAVVAQQWEQPYFLVAPETKIADFIEPNSKPHLDFTYWPWGEPEQIVEALKNGQPLPDRLSVPIAEPDPTQTAARAKDQNIRITMALGLIIFGIFCLILIFR